MTKAIKKLSTKYGAFEIKLSINQNTVKGLISSTLLFLMMFGLIFTFTKTPTNVDDTIKNIIDYGTTEIIPLPDIEELKPKGTSSNGGSSDYTSNVSTNQVSSNSTLGLPNMSDFIIESNIGGFGNQPSNPNIDFSVIRDISTGNGQSNKSTTEEIPYNEGIIEEPSFDYRELKKRVEYPSIAIRNKIEGRVEIRVLIDENGNIKDYKILSNTSSILNNSALEAIKEFGGFKPAIQNGRFVSSWVVIPIVFKLQ
jgi:TonB family protein